MDNKAESISVTASSSGHAIASRSVQILPAAVSAAKSTVTASPGTLSTGSATTITVTLLDPYSNPIPAVSVTLTGNHTATITGSPAATNANGVVSFSGTDSVAEADSFSAASGGTPIGSAGVTFTPGTATNVAVVSGTPQLTAISGPALISGSTLTYTGGGTVVVEADQAGNTSYAAAIPVQRTISVQVAPTITFTIPNHAYGDPAFAVSASSDSPGALSYTLVSCNATVTPGGLVTLTGTGPVTVQVAQAASSFYLAGTMDASFTVSLVTPTLVFAAIPAHTYGDAPLTVSATSASSGAVTYTVTSGPATIAGNLVTLTGIGMVVLRASQEAAGAFG